MPYKQEKPPADGGQTTPKYNFSYLIRTERLKINEKIEKKGKVDSFIYKF